MKYIAVLLIVFGSFSIKSQDFEGSISWSVSMEITDPELKKKLESANQQLSNPANQAKIKELQKTAQVSGILAACVFIIYGGYSIMKHFIIGG